MQNMNESDKIAVNETLSELSNILNQFSWLKWAFPFFALIAISTIGIIVIINVGEILGIIIICVAFGPLFFNEWKGTTTQEIAYEACLCMDAVIKIYEKTYGNPSVKYICPTATNICSVNFYNGNLHLYNKFIRYMPQMKSIKLKFLAKVKLSK